MSSCYRTSQFYVPIHGRILSLCVTFLDLGREVGSFKEESCFAIDHLQTVGPASPARRCDLPGVLEAAVTLYSAELRRREGREDRARELVGEAAEDLSGYAPLWEFEKRLDEANQARANPQNRRPPPKIS